MGYAVNSDRAVVTGDEQWETMVTQSKSRPNERQEGDPRGLVRDDSPYSTWKVYMNRRFATVQLPMQLPTWNSINPLIGLA